MALRFSGDGARYNPYTDVVTFFAMDGDTMVMCTVTRDSLESLENATGLTDWALVAAFAKHRARIERMVRERHGRRPQLVFALVAADFSERQGTA